MNEEYGKKLPFQMSAEQSLLGSILIDPQSINEIADLIKPEDFYVEEHKNIYLAARELFIQNKEIDVVTLIDMLVKSGVFEQSGGEDYIRTICESVPTAMNIKGYAKIVKEKSALRHLISVCDELTEKAYEEQTNSNGLIELAEQKIYEIAEGKDTQNFKTINEVLHSVYKNLHELYENPDALKGTKTGFSGLDKTLITMGNSDLILIGARPGMGKTSFALNIASNVAIQTGKSVCIFSLEMSAEQLVTRLISSDAMVESQELRSGRISQKSWDDIAETASKLNKTKILIDDTSGITVTEMKAKLRRVKDLGLVVIDYLQLMQSDRKIDNRVQEVADISRGLKIMAKELNVPIICCAQLSRAGTQRKDNRPMLTDLRDSGAIEQDADVVIFLYREEYYKTDGTPDQNGENNIAEVIISKNRHGAQGTVKMGWIGKYTKFMTIDENREGQQ